MLFHLWDWTMTDGAGEKRALNNPGNSAPFLILTDVHRVKYLIITFSVCVCVCARERTIKGKDVCTHMQICFFGLRMWLLLWNELRYIWHMNIENRLIQSILPTSCREALKMEDLFGSRAESIISYSPLCFRPDSHCFVFGDFI